LQLYYQIEIIIKSLGGLEIKFVTVKYHHRGKMDQIYWSINQTYLQIVQNLLVFIRINTVVI